MADPAIPPTAFVHVDVDGLWALRRCYAVPEGDALRADPCWDEGLPALRSLVEGEGLAASFFLVGRDLGIAAKRRAARALADAGHELGNHSFTHDLALGARPPRRIRREIAAANDAFRRARLPAPSGFRAPGYSYSSSVPRAVRAEGLAYDASLLATWLTHPLRLVDAVASRRLDPRKRQFGRLRDALSSRYPHEREGIWEVPVGSFGMLGWPLTGSAVFAFGAPRIVARLERIRRRRQPVLLLLHAADLVDFRGRGLLGPRTPKLAGFDQCFAEKRASLAAVLGYMRTRWTVRLSGDWVRERAAPTLRRPVFLPSRVRLS